MINILISGDFCPINRTEKLAKTGNYKSIYNDYYPVLEENDLTITNLECPLYNGSKTIDKVGPSLKADENLTEVLKQGHFNLVTLANNHLMDFGVDGLNSTINACTKARIETVGAGNNLNEARRAYYATIKGVRIAILNFAENEFSTTHGEEPGVNPLNPVTNFYDIKEAKANADHVFVIIHGGHEHYQLPSPRMQETYRFFIDSGADAVIGHHTHCYSGYEIYQGKPIFYSLGNFIFDWPKQQNSIWNSGYSVRFTINDGIINFTLHPYIQCDIKPGVRPMSESEMKDFEKQLALLNQQIGNRQILDSKFQEFLKSKKQEYLSRIEPYSNKYILELFNRGFIPSLVSSHKKRFLLHLIRCEAHRDLIIDILKKEIK